MNAHIAAPAALIAFIVGIWLLHLGGPLSLAIGVAIAVFCLGLFINYIDSYLD